MNTHTQSILTRGMPVPGLTFRQQEILFLLYRYRFLHSGQLQEFLGHRAHNRVRMWLTDLTDKGYINGIYQQFIRQDRTPSIYYLSREGIGFIHSRGTNNSYIRKLLNEPQARFPLLDHCLKIADISLLLSSYCQQNEMGVSIATKADLAVHPEYAFIKPDLFLRLSRASYFLELDRETESLAKMQQKLRSYIKHYKSNQGVTFSNNLYPCIVFISLSPARVMRLKDMCEKLLTREGFPQMLVKLTTVDWLENQGLTQNICMVPFKNTEGFLLL